MYSASYRLYVVAYVSCVTKCDVFRPSSDSVTGSGRP